MATQTNQPGARDTGAGAGGGGDAAAKAQEVVGQAQDKAQAAAGQLQDRLREQLDQRSAQAAAQINQQASDLRSVSQALREQGQEGPAGAADRLASYGEKVGGYLRDKDADSLLREAEDFGRRKAAAVVAGGLMLGFAAARFLKASSSRRYAAHSAEHLSRPQSDSGSYGQPSGGSARGATPMPGDDAGESVQPPVARRV